MPRPKRTQEEIAFMQRRILDATHDLLYEGGPASVTVRRIASRLGVSHMTLYNYFSNRDAILQALSERHFAEIAARRSQQLHRAREGQVIEVIRDELVDLARQIQDRPELFRLMTQCMLSNEAGDDEQVCLRERQSAYIDHLAELIEIGKEQDIIHVSVPQLAALAIASAVSGPLTLLVSDWLDDKTTFWKAYDEVIDMITMYLGKT